MMNGGRRLDRSSSFEVGSLLIGAGLAAIVLFVAARGPEVRFEELALGRATSSHYPEIGGVPIHCTGVIDESRCIEGYEQRGSDPLVLWLGNSQLHGINQYRPGDTVASELLFERLRPLGYDLLTFSQPNASLQEHYLLYAHLLRHLDPEVLILPLVFDDTRESGIRAELAEALADSGTAAFLESDPVGRRILENSNRIGGDLAALDQTIQDHSERWLDDWLSRRSALWAARPQLRGSLFRELRRLRNWVFGIDAQSKRRLLEGAYAENLDALRSILSDAHRRGIRVLTYVAPLRGDLERPYVESEYARFKRDAERIAREAGADFRDLEDIVPGELWGEGQATEPGEAAAVDFMHFQAGGHARLAARVYAELAPDLERRSR